jgi:hypothetical protein
MSSNNVPPRTMSVCAKPVGAAAENAEEWMAGFVNHEISEIEEEKTGTAVCGVHRRKRR